MRGRISKRNIANQVFGVSTPVGPAGDPALTQSRVNAGKVRSGRPGNSHALKQSGPFFLRCTQPALTRHANEGPDHPPAPPPSVNDSKPGRFGAIEIVWFLRRPPAFKAVFRHDGYAAFKKPSISMDSKRVAVASCRTPDRGLGQALIRRFSYGRQKMISVVLNCPSILYGGKSFQIVQALPQPNNPNKLYSLQKLSKPLDFRFLS